MHDSSTNDFPPMSPLASTSEGMPSPKPDRFSVPKMRPVENKYVEEPKPSPSLAFKNQANGSLRKQRVASTSMEQPAVEYVSSAKVADVLALSKAKENQSQVEKTGVSRVAKMGVGPPTRNTWRASARPSTSRCRRASPAAGSAASAAVSSASVASSSHRCVRVGVKARRCALE